MSEHSRKERTESDKGNDKKVVLAGRQAGHTRNKRKVRCTILVTINNGFEYDGDNGGDNRQQTTQEVGVGMEAKNLHRVVDVIALYSGSHREDHL